MVAAVFIAAAVDAVRRDDPEPTPAATTDIEGRAELAEQLAGLGARGELLLEQRDCRVLLLELPSLERTGDDLSGCAPRGAASPDETTFARCNGARVEVYHVQPRRLVYTLPGCAPAWRPDGVLTATYRDAVIRYTSLCTGAERCFQTLISRAELERAARRHPTSPALAPLRVLVDGVAWLSQRRAAVLLSIRLAGRYAGMGPMAAIAFFEDGRLTETQPYFRVTGGRLGASPRGTYVTQTPDVILRGDGSQVSLPRHLGVVQAFAWSPDERFLALATRYAVVVVSVASLEEYDRTGGGLRSVTIPQPAASLRWR